MSTLEIETAAVFRPLLKACRYKGAYGGRGSGKSHFFAEALVEDAIRFPGLRAVCIREVQKSLKESAKKLIEDKIQALNVGPLFDVQTAEIKTPGGGSILFQGMQDHTAESIKSLEGMDRAWVEEAQTLSEGSWRMLRPTIRKEKSEIWASWNPRRKLDPVDMFFRQSGPDPNVTCVKANWKDNPWFPAVLEEERCRDLRNDADAYPNVWDGEYVAILKGAYYAEALRAARNEGRIGIVKADPLIRKRAWWDIGGAGANADANAIWVTQDVGPRVLVLDYIEGVGQVLSYYLNELTERGHKNALCVLPHDGGNTNNVTGLRYAQHIRDGGFDAIVMRNQGKGAALLRVTAGRRIFPRCWFNEETTQPGLEALGNYHEKRDEERNVGLGPEHDWSSNGSDAYGMMAMAHIEPPADDDDDSPAPDRTSSAGY